LWQRLETEIAGLPGVVSVGTTSAGPLFGGGDGADNAHYQADDARHRAPVEWFDMSPGYFAALGVPVVRGRALDEADRRGTPDVAVVNEAMARRFWPNENPIGKQVAMFDDRATFQIVGVVRDIPEVNSSTPTPARMFWSNRQSPRPFTFFLVRTSVAPASLASAIRQRLRDIDRNLIPSNVQTMPELMTMRLKTPRFDMTLLFMFAVAALALDAIGTYGLFAYHIARRTREIGIRIALGATRGHVVGMFLRRAIALVVAGLAIGAPAAWALRRTASSFLFQMDPGDPRIFVAALAVLAASALVASWLPARRAANVDPLIALRSD
jgi:predicted permease